MAEYEFEKELKELPALIKGKGLWQNKFHEFDVYKHTLEFVRHIKKMTDDKDLVCAGYLHDIGKSVVAKKKYRNGELQRSKHGKIYHKFNNHENIGEEMVKEMNPDFFQRYGLDQERIAKLVGIHYLPMKGIKRMRKSKDHDGFLANYNNLKHDLEDNDLPKEDVLLMFLADKLAQGKGCTDKEELLKIRDALLGNEGYLKKIYRMQKKYKKVVK